jgi:3-oxoacyl-[acyl-carrier-protein] synthase II
MNKRIVITGVGVLAPNGIGKEEFWTAIFQGKPGFRPISLFDTADLKVKVGGEITNFDPKAILGSKSLMDLDRATLLLSAAAKLALDDAKLNITQDNAKQIGVSIGTTFGSLHSISKFDRESLSEGPRYANPSVFPSTVGNSPASRLSIRFNIKGFNSTISTGMCAALDALDYACDFINLGRTNTVIVGSVEDFTIQTFLGFYKLKYLSGLHNGNLPLSCPFDKRRDGIIFSEGSSVFVVEEMDSALKRKANIYAEILGIGSCFDPAKFYRFDPKGEGMVQAMHLALNNAHLKPQDIDCIFANANSTRDADKIETKAIKEVYGNYADKIPVTAIKSMLGETFSASAGLATAAAIAALEKNQIPPTINYKVKDPECELDYVVNELRKTKLQRVMLNAFGPNGANTVVIIGEIK